MCGIIGFFNNKNAFKLAINGLGLIKNRGKDGFGIASDKKAVHKKKLDDVNKIKSENIIGHNLHSVVNNIMQPFFNKDSRFVINCEIYNWKELSLKYNIKARNDSELVFFLLEKKGIKILDELQGVYAFAYWKKDKVYLARDIIGVKPIWYSRTFCFCSEKKALEKQSIKDIEELNPRHILEYDIKKDKIKFIERDFFKINPEHRKRYEILKKEVKGLLIKAVSKRIPDKKFGILFSGGVDSTLIALICKQLGLDFTCYTAGLKEGNFEVPSDIVYSKKIAKKYGFKLKIKTLDLKETEKYIKKIAPLIEDNTVVKVGVALPLYAACEMAKKDKVKVIFSGLGAEEIFAGYERHKKSSNVNNECLSGLLKIYERDLYRDDTVSMNNKIELRLPFLDKELVEYSLKIPGKYKLKEEHSKFILRDIAEELGLEKEFAFRKKVGAQYGSKFSRAIVKLARGKDSKAEYLSQFYKKPNVKLAALVSGGKDGMFAAYLMHVHNYSIECLVTIKSKNPDSYMYHTPNIDIVELQAKAMEVPLVIETTKGEKEKELNSLKKALKKAKEKYNIEGIVSGAIFSNYQRQRIDKICDSLGLKNFVPLWHMDQELEMRHLLKNNFSFLMSSIACDGLDKKWLGKVISEDDIDNLVKLNKKIGINIAGEGGEFESLVLDCPLFRKKIKVAESSLHMENPYTGKFIVKKADLSIKN